MVTPFSFEGRLSRLPYGLTAVGLFLSQHLVTWLIASLYGRRVVLDWEFLFVPLRTLGAELSFSPAIQLAALAQFLLVAWVLAALSYRRATDAGLNAWIAAAAMAPIVQVLAIAVLCHAPSATPDVAEKAIVKDGPARTGWRVAIQGLFAGTGLTLVAVAVGTLIFGTYGFGLFMVTPIVIGAITAYLANREADIGGKSTAKLVAGAAALGGIGLVVVSLEGLICILMAAPLGIGVALIGGLLGRAIAQAKRARPGDAIPAIALVPLVFALESALQFETRFDTRQTIEVEAPAQAVWKAILDMERIEEPPTLLHRLGVAYPIRGTVVGEGIGATRYGEFSTGTAVERVTEWEPNRKLEFVVLKDVPALIELSPYETVHAPHAVGYFRTTKTSFELIERGKGRTTIVERTSHELKLDPAFYWMPFTQWMVEKNNLHVLAHIARQAERNSPASQQRADVAWNAAPAGL